MSCLDNIVTIKGCGDTAPLSGLDLMDAPEITPLGLANIATEKDQTGTALAQRALANAHVLVRNDLINTMSANSMLVDITAREYSTGVFVPTTTIPADGKEKGITLIKANKYRVTQSIRKLKIKTIKIFPLQTATGVPLYIHDSGNVQPITSEYSVNLVQGVIKEVLVNYEVLGTQAHITLDGSVALGSSKLTCFTGCGGTLPNDCAHTKGYYDGRNLSSKEGHGINLDFVCECDYDQIPCNIAKTSYGMLVWMKARIGIMEALLNSNRLNNDTVYGREEIMNYHLPKLQNEYSQAWEPFAKSLPQILNQYSGECIVCKGIRHVVSI